LPFCAFLTVVLVLDERAPVLSQPVDPGSVRPFTIRVPDAAIADLKARLGRARFPTPLQGDGWTYGTDVRYLKELVDYWRDRFNWREQERRLNTFEQFTTTIDGLNIHFIHRRSKQPRALPLLITHGWPGSFVEFTKIIGPLTDPASYGGRPEDAFDVVIPSIPGFAFSDAPHEPGYAPARIAETEARLMARLGYTRYGTQGGDWGSIIATQIALNDAAHVVGLHINMCTGAAPAGADPNAGLSASEIERVKQRQTFQRKRPAIRRFRARSRRRSAWPSMIRRWGWRRGLWKSSARGAIATVIPRKRSPRTSS
jgi:pimeloyl-ACP methyl ester carboxylesterase